MFLYMYVWFRATLPRFRYDQLMDLGWKVLIPVSFGWLLLLIVNRVVTSIGWDRVGRLGAMLSAVIVIMLGYLLLARALQVSAARRSEEGTMY